MKRAAILACALAACSPAAENAAAPGGSDAQPVTSEKPAELPIGATAPTSIAGEWRVAGVNGEAIDIGWAMTASITADQISIQSQCMEFGRMYALDGTRLSKPDVPPAPEVPPATGPMPPPPPVCTRMFLPEEQAVSKALQDADLAYRLPDGSLVLDGPGGSLTLYTQ